MTFHPRKISEADELETLLSDALCRCAHHGRLPQQHPVLTWEQWCESRPLITLEPK